MTQQEGASQYQSTPASSHISGAALRSSRPSKFGRHRQSLVDLLPSQPDVDLICDNSSCWLVIRGFGHIGADSSVENGDEIIHSTFNVKEVSKKNPTAIARTLLYVALCLQQLPSNLESRLANFPMPVKTYAEKLMSTVQALITSDDELVSTVEGLECLLLQGIYHTNGGNPKRAWLSFRRAGNIGQLMGIDKIDNSIRGGSERWYQIVQEDRYLVCFNPCYISTLIYCESVTSPRLAVCLDRRFLQAGRNVSESSHKQRLPILQKASRISFSHY